MAQMIRLLMTTAIFAKQKGGSLDTALLVLCVFSYVLENRPAALRAYIGKSDSIPPHQRALEVTIKPYCWYGALDNSTTQPTGNRSPD